MLFLLNVLCNSTYDQSQNHGIIYDGFIMLLFDCSVIFLSIFLVQFYQDKKQRQEKEAKRFKGMEYFVS